MMPMGPAWTGWWWVRPPLPAIVSTTGIPRSAANLATAASAARVAHAAARDDERLLGSLEKGRSLDNGATVGTRARDRPDAGFEEFDRIVEGDFLCVLAKADECGAAIRRIEHRSHRLRK